MAALTALLASAGGVSCAGGIHDSNDQPSVTWTLDSGGSHIAMMEAVFDFPAGSVQSPTLVTLSRFKTIPYTGALSPVFRLQVPDQHTFQLDPTLTILTTADIAKDDNSYLGYLAPDENIWIPMQPNPLTGTCDPSTVCGAVQSQAFSDHKTKFLDLAVVTRCNSDQVCQPRGLVCVRGEACQDPPPASP